jgi:hypothetical protein
MSSAKPQAGLTNVTGVSVSDGGISWNDSNNGKGEAKLQNLLFVLDRAQSPGQKTGYIISILVENPESPEDRFRLLLLLADAIPDELRQRLITGLPSYLRPINGKQEVDVVVSTKSGVGLSLQFWQSVLQPLWTVIAEQSSDADGRESPNVLVTEDAQSVRKFARRVGGSEGKSAGEIAESRTIILLSGDGGVVDLINGSSHDESVLEQRQLLLALLPLGTGNALFHSLHKPLGKTEDASPLVLGLRTLFSGVPANLPLFRASFSPGSRIVKFTPTTEEPLGDDASSNPLHLEKEETRVSHLFGAVVASYGFHSSIVYESDTPEYRVHGDKRFGMVAHPGTPVT